MKKSLNLIRAKQINSVLWDTWRRLFARRAVNFSSLVCYNKNGRLLVGGVCDYDTKDRKRSTELVPLLSCDPDFSNHKSSVG